MKLFKMFAAVLSVAVLCLLAVPIASADDWNRKTVITFSGPVEVPGVARRPCPLARMSSRFWIPVRPPYRPDIQSRRNPCIYHHPCNPKLSVENYRQDRDQFPGAASGTTGSPQSMVLSRAPMG